MDSYSILLLSSAKVDLRRLYEYLSSASNSPARMAKVVEGIYHEIASLAYMPERNAVYEACDTVITYRRAIYDKYLILYTVDSDDCKVNICRIVDGRRDVRNVLE